MADRKAECMIRLMDALEAMMEVIADRRAFPPCKERWDVEDALSDVIGHAIDEWHRPEDY